MSKIKVLVVDDSALMRKIISDMVNSQEDMEVIGKARNGVDLLKKIESINPDVITLDIEMPEMDGITALKTMKEKGYHIPIIVLSSFTENGTKLTMECLHNGAFDFIAKPSGSISIDINSIKDDIVKKVRLAAGKGRLEKKSPMQSRKIKKQTNSSLINKKNRLSKHKIKAVAIGASTGGPKAIFNVITKLPAGLNVPVFVVQHMPVGFTKAFAERLNAHSKLEVKEGYEGCLIEKNTVYIAPGGSHMTVGDDNKIHLNKEPAIWGVRPAVDKLFISASHVFKNNLLSVVMTGMGKDGAQGTEIIKNSKGITISEDESTCVIYGMPKAAYETGKVDIVLPLDEIAQNIVSLVKEC